MRVHLALKMLGTSAFRYSSDTQDSMSVAASFVLTNSSFSFILASGIRFQRACSFLYISQHVSLIVKAVIHRPNTISVLCDASSQFMFISSFSFRSLNLKTFFSFSTNPSPNSTHPKLCVQIQIILAMYYI